MALYYGAREMLETKKGIRREEMSAEQGIVFDAIRKNKRAGIVTNMATQFLWYAVKLHQDSEGHTDSFWDCEVEACNKDQQILVDYAEEFGR